MNGVLITLNERELSDVVSAAVRGVLSEREEESRKQELQRNPIPQQYYTAKEAAAKLRLSLPTLWRYEKNGVICAKRVGRRVLYNRNEVDGLFSKGGA